MVVYLFRFILIMYIKGSSKQGMFTLCDVICRDRIIWPIRRELSCTGCWMTGLEYRVCFSQKRVLQFLTGGLLSTSNILFLLIFNDVKGHLTLVASKVKFILYLRPP